MGTVLDPVMSVWHPRGISCAIIVSSAAGFSNRGPSLDSRWTSGSVNRPFVHTFHLHLQNVLAIAAATDITFKEAEQVSCCLGGRVCVCACVRV